ncbi:hypothetical protein [Devosia sp. Leaf420]|uniref:hypothetical protein n=1 Tax=Devosia sp. Leaf420 TaxID=1736374 RepID=UPI0012E8911B|nr:hypothetical protein [Devosia sp. Leaf420]
MNRLSLIDSRARADAIRHMTASGLCTEDLVIAGIRIQTIRRALRRTGRARLAAKAVRS